MFADFKADLLVSQIHFDPKPLIFQEFGRPAHVIGLPVGDIHDHGLYRGQPGRELPGVVFDENGQESLHGAQDRPMQHDRAVGSPILADVFSTQALGQHEVDLQGAALPVPADRVLEHELEFRAIERPLARVQGVFEPRQLDGA